MSIYAIGDVHGCYSELLQLLDLIHFDPHADQLWFTGDLINRGPKSLETLRLVKSLGTAAVTVLGNHDLHVIHSFTQPQARKKATLLPLWQAPDAEALIYWLRHQSLIHYQAGFCLLHAGLPPAWDIKQALALAAEAEQVLRSDNYVELIAHCYTQEPNQWSAQLTGLERLRFIVHCFTRMRYCDAQGNLDFACVVAPGSQPAHLFPWFAHPQRQSKTTPIIFGHWSTLGYYAGYNCHALDSGCLWGGALTALKLDTLQCFSVPSPGYQQPGLMGV